MEIVHDGWLLKSPPPKRLWRAKWRDRWFVLRSGDLPGQYFLEYYTDSTCRKLKGKIDLDQCEQIDAGITFTQRKFEYKFMFDIKTPKRVYYLCADTEEAMNKWVEIICQVCGLRVMASEDFEPMPSQLSPNTPQMMADGTFDSRRPLDGNRLDSPPPSACSMMSGPYIPISECITGRRVQVGTRFPFSDDSHLSLGDNHHPSIPNMAAPRAPSSASALQALARTARWPKPKDANDRAFSQSTSEDSSMQSPFIREGVYPGFPDHNPLSPVPPADGSGLSGATRKKSISSVNSAVYIPPRPPKPAHLADQSHQNYMNVDCSQLAAVRGSCSSDKSRGSSHAPSATTGPKTSISSSDAEPSPLPAIIGVRSPDALLAAAGGTTPRGAECPRNFTSGGSKIFSYEGIACDKSTDPRISPAGIYSNVPSAGRAPDGPSPPTVDRGLKPKTQSDSSPVDGSQEGALVAGGAPVPPSSAPPTVHRSLKPHQQKKQQESQGVTPKLTLAPVPRSRFHNSNQRKPRAGPSPTHQARIDTDSDDHDSSPVFRNDSSFHEQVFFPMNTVTRRASNEIQYLDLDLDSTLGQQSPKNGLKPVNIESSVVYKKVDFLKTEAFNKTRQSIEEDRKGQ